MKENEVQNIMIVGVGGQGALLASKTLGQVLLDAGFDVKVSEIHGMSQRGGSVVTYVRYGKKVYSPIIDKGEADFIVSFELLEAARYTEFLKKNGKIVVNTQQIDPMPVITGATKYPDNIVQKMQDGGFTVDSLDCLSLEKQAVTEKEIFLYYSPAEIIALKAAGKAFAQSPGSIEYGVSSSLKISEVSP